MVAGALVLTVSMVMFTQLGTSPSVVVIVLALALSGLGIGVSTPSTASSASNEVLPEELGVMSAAQLLITQIGVVAGIQVMVTVEASAHGGVGSLASFHRAYAVGGDRGAGRGGLRVLRRRHPASGAHRSERGAAGLSLKAPQAVMAWMREAISAAVGSGDIVWSAISLAMSPSTLILPCMKAWRPACGLPSTRISLAMS